MRNFSILAFVLCALGSATAACGSDQGVVAPSNSEADVGKVTLAASLVPANVSCIQVDVDMVEYPWAHLATQTFAATPNAQTWPGGSVQLGQFTQGPIWVKAQAFSAACGSQGTTPQWVADTLLIDLTPGFAGAAVLKFRQNYGVVASANFEPSVTDLSVGQTSVGLKLADGSVKMVGYLNQVALTTVAEIAVGQDHACARKTDGTVWCWGANTYGQLGNGTTTPATVPVQATGVAGAISLSAGTFTSCAGKSNGVTNCWGYNVNGSLGNNSTTNSSTPVAVQVIGAAVKIATTNDHTCAIQANGQVYCWGKNDTGMLGNGGTTNSLIPVYTGLASGVSVAVGEAFSCAVNAAGTPYCWGNNSSGQIGNNTTTQVSVPTAVTALGSNVAEVALAGSTACALTKDGLVYCWGSNLYGGAVGDGSGVNRLLPVQVLTDAKSIRGGNRTMCSLMADASVDCWGDNAWGQLGDTTTASHLLPTPLQL